jgi:Co/Zn/Cd efflux system component
MKSCCESGCAAEALRDRQRGTLVKVLWINAVMFVAIVGAAIYGKSTALLSDSLDNLGDALTYALSLFAVSRSAASKARVALFKGGLIFLAAGVVIAQVVHRIIYPVLPSYEIMSVFSGAGLLANGLCLFLLWRHRQDDINMSSVYECSRNDIASNLSVLVAAAGVWILNSGWPDIIVGTLLAAFLLRSSARVIRGALAELSPRQAEVSQVTGEYSNPRNPLSD